MVGLYGQDPGRTIVDKPSMIDKYELRRIRSDIRQVLMEIWDPIGVKDVRNAQDEYDSYISGIYGLLTGEVPDSQIAEHLLGIVRETMGMEAADLDAMSDTVNALRLIRLPSKS